MEKNISDTKVNNVKNVARLSIARADVKSIKVVDADIVIYLKTGKRIVVRDGVVKAMMDPDFSIGFVDGEISAQAALQQSGLVDLNPISTATVASTPDAAKTDDSATSTSVGKSVMSSETPSYADTAAPVAIQAPTSAPDVVAQAKPAPAPSLFETVRPYIGALGLLGLASGGGGSSAASAGASSITADTVVSGNLVLGPVTSSNGLTVNLYKADGTWLGSSDVASGGAFSVKLSDKTYTGPIIAVVSDNTNGVGGEDFVDEATGAAKDLGAKYMAIQTVAAGVATSLNINALTTVAAIHAGVPKEWDEGKASLSKIITTSDVTTNNAAVGRMFGISNIVTDSVSPIINSSGSYVASGDYYGQVLAAISGVDKNTGDQKTTIDTLVANSAGGTLTSAGVETIVKGASVASTEASTVAKNVDAAGAKTAASYDTATTLTATEVNGLSLSTVASLSAIAVQKIGADIINLSSAAFKAINFSYLSDTQVAALSAEQVASLNKVQLARMLPKQLAALGDNITYLSLTTLANLSQSSSDNLTTDQLLALAEKGMLDNLSTQLTTTQVDGLAGSLAGTISAADTKLFNSILADVTDGGGTTDLSISEKRFESATKIEMALEVVHQLTLIAELDPSSATYAAALTRLSDEVTGAKLQLIGLAGTNGAYTEPQKNALLTKVAEGVVADITGIAYLQSLVDVVNPTLSASTLPSTSKEAIYHLAGDGIGETISLTITFSEKVKGLTSGTDSTIFKVDGVVVEGAWSGIVNTSTRTLTYTIVANQNGKVTIDEAALKTALLNSITDTAGNALIYESVIAEIDSSTFAQVDGVAPTLTLTALGDTDLSLAQATAFKQTYTALDNAGGLGIRSTVAVVLNSANEVQSGVTLTTTGDEVTGNLSSLDDGTYTLQVTTTDLAGNTDVKSQTFLIDKVAPTLNLAEFSDTQTKLTSAEAALYTQTYTSDDNMGGTGLASTVAVVKNASGATQSGVTLTTTGGNVSGNLSSLADGHYTVEVTSTDIAGNTFIQTQDLVIDKTPPVLNLSTLGDDKLTSSQAQSYTQTYETTDATTGVATTVARVLNSSNVAQGITLSTTDGNVSGDLSSLTDGTYTIEVTSTDKAGNTTVKTQVVVIDATPPTLSLNSLSDAQLTGAEAAAYSQSFSVNDVTSGVRTTTAVVTNSNGVIQNGVTLSTANNKVEGDLSSLGGNENYFVNVTTTDQAGNIAVQSQALYLDKTAPTTTPLTISSIAKFADLNLGFSEAVVKGASGSIYICKTDGTVVETIAVTSNLINVSGDGKLVTINPANDLVVGTSYYARVDAGAFTDPSGNPIAAITANVWNFNAVSVGSSLVIGGTDVNANEGHINEAELANMTLSGVITNAVGATDVAVTRVMFHATDNSGDIIISSSSLSGLLPVIDNNSWQLANDPVWTDQLVSGKTYTVSVDVGGDLDGVAVSSTVSSAQFVVDTEAPIISIEPLNASENGTAVGTAVAADSSSVSWSLVGSGADDAKFNISSAGVLTLKADKDFETPSSAAGTNAYVVNLKATDAAGNFSIQDVTVNVTNVNEAPVNTVPGAQTAVEEAEKVIVGLSIGDVDAGTENNVITTLSVSSGTLNVSGGTAAITGNGSSTVTLTGSVVQINATLAAANAVKYTSGLNFNGNANLTMTTNDAGNTGTGGPLSDTDTVTISVTAVNDNPVLTAGKAWTYTENAAASVVDNTITLSDVDDTQITGATVTISTGLTADDVLNFATIGTISGTYNSGTGVLTLTGTATKEDYQAALRTVTYSNASEDPTVNGTKPSRTITWAVTDANSDGVGPQTNVGVTSTITLAAVNDAPTLTTTISTPDYANTAGDQQLFSSTSVSAFESAQSIKSMIFTVAGVTGTSTDRIKVDGVYVNLVTGTTGTTSFNSVSYSVAVANSTATVMLTSVAGLTNAVAQNLVNGLAYNNSTSAAGGSAAGMDGDRVITLTEITDSGTDNNVTSLNFSSTVKDTTPPPTISSVALSADTGNADLVTQTANQTVTATLSRALAISEKLEATLDGINWTNITTFVSGASVSWTSATLVKGTNPLTLRTVDAASNTVLSSTRNYTLLQTMTISDVVDDKGANTLTNSVAKGASTYRYVYIRYDPTTSTLPNLAELVVMSNGVNIAAGKTVTSSMGQYSTSEGFVNLTDGNTGTAWAASNGLHSSGWLQLDLGAAYHIDSTALSGSIYATSRAQGFTTWLSSSDLSGTTLAGLPAAGAVQIQTTTSAFGSSDPFLVGRLVSTDDTTPTLSGTLSAALPTNYKVQIFNNGTYLADAAVTNSNGSVTWNYTFAAGQAVYGTNMVEVKVIDGTSATYLSSNYSFDFNANVSIAGVSESGMPAGNTNTLSANYRYVYIRIEDWARNNTNFAELMVYSDGVNVALNKAVTNGINADMQTWSAVGNLVDGSTGSTFATGYSYYSGGAARNGWVMVDLGQSYAIDSVLLFGSTESAEFARAATVWVSSSYVSPSSNGALAAAPGTVQLITYTSAFTSASALTGYIPTDDTTPTIYGTLETGLGAGYKLGIYDNSAYLGDATVGTDNTWTYTVGTAMVSGSTHNLSAHIYQGYTNNVLATNTAATNIYFKISPIVLDLNHDGQISYSNVLMDVTGAGVISKVTWAAPEDGVLVWNKYGDGLVHDKSQYAFGDPAKGITDLQGLAQNFDSNHDGVFNASDDKFGQFMVWQDQNGDGLSQAGEVKSLADTGLTSLNLNSDGVKSAPTAGVEEAGRSTATQTDGQSMLVADATFSYTKALVLQGVDASQDSFTIKEGLTQINTFNGGDGDVIDLSGLLSQLHTSGGNVADYVQTVQRGNDTVIQVDATGHHDFVNASNQVVLMNTTTTWTLLQQQNHVVI